MARGCSETLNAKVKEFNRVRESIEQIQKNAYKTVIRMHHNNTVLLDTAAVLLE